jgi:hypothetical protein
MNDSLGSWTVPQDCATGRVKESNKGFHRARERLNRAAILLRLEALQFPEEPAMSGHQDEHGHREQSENCPCHHQSELAGEGISRRDFLGGLGGAAVLGGVALAAAESAKPAPAVPSPVGAPLRVKPALIYSLAQRQQMTSWRPYGGLKTPGDVQQEAKRIEQELRALSAKAEFGLQILPVALVNNQNEAAAVAGADCDAILVYASGGAQQWLEALAASGKPNVMFVRHRSGPVYLWYEIAHYRFLRKNEDTMKDPHMDCDDIVVDEYADVLWRLRSLYGLKNTLGTKVLAIGGLQSYSKPGSERGPAYAKNTWKFDIQTATDQQVADRIKKAKADENVMRQVERQTADLIAQPGVTLQVDRKYVVNTFLALHVFKELMAEVGGATNVGVANCMGGLIRILDTPPCLVTSLLNDEGYTAFCHVDMTHTPPGVLLRHISGKPSFVSNSHFPHHGIITQAHCAAPRKMNGKDYEPTKIVSHFESDYGAATKVEYTKGQVTTNLVPNLYCTKWFGWRGKIIDSPNMDMCRSQMDVQIDGDWRKMLRDLQGFHTVTCYGDYLREVGYALKKVKIDWESFSETQMA